MTFDAEKALLPTGMCDGLPPEAAKEAACVERLMTAFAAWGYARVKPPLFEFEDSLLSGSGRAMATHAFRFADPASGRMLALRPDMTLQVARIASTRLKTAPRPLRLGYAGQIVRIKGSQLRPERQFGQVGAELIGVATPDADAEVILMAIESLAGIGVGALSVDLGIPTLVPAFCDDMQIAEAHRHDLRLALDRKDSAAVHALKDRIGADSARVLGAMLTATGPIERTLDALRALDLPEKAALERDRLETVARIVTAGTPDLKITADPVENRGFEYHSGVTFAFFSHAAGAELGRGGRYRTDDANGGEAATGLTLYMDTILTMMPPPPETKCIFLPAGTALDDARTLRTQGWRTISDLDGGGADHPDFTSSEREIGTTADKARRMSCSHFWLNGTAVEI